MANDGYSVFGDCHSVVDDCQCCYPMIDDGCRLELLLHFVLVMGVDAVGRGVNRQFNRYSKTIHIVSVRFLCGYLLCTPHKSLHA